MLGWFEQTHDIEVIPFAGGHWRLRRLPRPGGLVAQDAKLMQALDHCRAVANGLLRERQAADPERALREAHEQIHGKEQTRH